MIGMSDSEVWEKRRLERKPLLGRFGSLDVWVISTHGWRGNSIVSTGDIHPSPVKKTAEIKGRNLVGRRLRELRLKQKPEVTLEDLAGRLAARGVALDRSAIGRIETRNRYVLDYELKALAEALKVRVEDLLH
jgi:hypothetical protein